MPYIPQWIEAPNYLSAMDSGSKLGAELASTGAQIGGQIASRAQQQAQFQQELALKQEQMRQQAAQQAEAQWMAQQEAAQRMQIANMNDAREMYQLGLSRDDVMARRQDEMERFRIGEQNKIDASIYEALMNADRNEAADYYKQQALESRRQSDDEKMAMARSMMDYRNESLGLREAAMKDKAELDAERLNLARESLGLRQQMADEQYALRSYESSGKFTPDQQRQLDLKRKIAADLQKKADESGDTNDQLAVSSANHEIKAMEFRFARKNEERRLNLDMERAAKR